jgi:hypothetical protein
MKAALYIGNHAGDTFAVRLGWFLTRLVQYISLTLRFKPTKYARVTHTELILDENADGSVTIASASIRDGFCVRTKTNVFLTPGNWIVRERPDWSLEEAKAWFVEHDGDLYDPRGAGVCWLPVSWSVPGRYFCNHADGAAVGMKNPEKKMPAEFAEEVMA